ncbi:hypothetical protein SCHPADRAFT_933773, partial [Schizopora paradoxa]
MLGKGVLGGFQVSRYIHSCSSGVFAPYFSRFEAFRGENRFILYFSPRGPPWGSPERLTGAGLSLTALKALRLFAILLCQACSVTVKALVTLTRSPRKTRRQCPKHVGHTPRRAFDCLSQFSASV